MVGIREEGITLLPVMSGVSLQRMRNRGFKASRRPRRMESERSTKKWLARSRENSNSSGVSSSLVSADDEPLQDMGQSMDASVWSNFPAELTEMVLARLPFQSLIRFRSVCKSWNYLLSSRAFLNEVDQTSAKEDVWFLSGTVTENKLAFYAPSLRKWHIPTVSSINMNFDDIVVPEATMGGLVCLTKYSSRPEEWSTITSELFVWNPLTNECRKLPDTSRTCAWPGLCVAGLFVDFAKKEYKLITVGNYQEVSPDNIGPVVVTEIYDSATNAWKICESLFPHETVSRLTRWNICCDGSVYSITKTPLTIVAFDMKTEVWREIAVPICVECPNLVELYNRLYMVAGISRDGSIRIWRLVEHADGRVQWIEVDRMPEELLRLLSKTGHTLLSIRHWRCVGSADSLFFRCWGSQDVLMYSISRRSWSWLPPCDLDNNRHYYAWNGLASSPGWMSP